MNNNTMTRNCPNCGKETNLYYRCNNCIKEMLTRGDGVTMDDLYQREVDAWYRAKGY